MKDEIVSLIQEMIRNRCVNPLGDEMKSIRTIERYLSSFGVESEIFESAPDRGNLLATIKGTGEGPSLMLGPGHVDGSLDMGTLQSMFHGTDERIPIGTLEMTAKGYMELARRFLS